MAGRSFWRTGHFLLLDAHASFAYNGLYALIAGLPLAIWGPETGLIALKLLQAVFVTSAAGLTYVWAHRLTGAWWSLAAAAAVASLPALGYSGLIMSEAVYLPAMTLALFAMAMAVESPTRTRQVIAAVVVVGVVLVRLQGLVLVPTFVLAVLLAAWFTRDRAVVRKFAPSFVVLAATGVVLLILYVLDSFSRPLGGYTTVAQSDYALGPVLLWTTRHAGDLFLLVAGVPLIATILMGVQAARGLERDTRVAATLAVTLAYAGLLVVQVGAFAVRVRRSTGRAKSDLISSPSFRRLRRLARAWDASTTTRRLRGSRVCCAACPVPSDAASRDPVRHGRRVHDRAVAAPPRKLLPPRPPDPLVCIGRLGGRPRTRASTTSRSRACHGSHLRATHGLRLRGARPGEVDACPTHVPLRARRSALDRPHDEARRLVCLRRRPVLEPRVASRLLERDCGRDSSSPG